MKKIILLVFVIALVMSMAIAVSAEDTYSLTVSDAVTILINGEKITENTTVTATDKIELPVADENVVAIGCDGVYYPVNEEFSLVADADFTEAAQCRLGLEMINGAQVRVGNVELDEDELLDLTADSGLRFVATANYTDTVIADENIEFGMKITAEDAGKFNYVPAEKFQKQDKTVFTVAITHLKTSNFNRKYTASAYALVPMHDGTVAEFTTGSVTRSIYQVSVGILKNSSAEANDNLPYTIDDAVKNVLNAYVNQTGIRLTYAADGSMVVRTEGSGAYSGDVYFDVSYTVNEDDSTDVVITPYGNKDGFANSVKIASWWQDYVRINNNNTTIQDYIHDAKIEDGVLSFTFAIPKTVEYTFNQEDSVTIVSEIGTDYIKGFKAGEEVTYSLAETVDVLGLAESMDDIVPGCVILTGTNSEGEVAAVELLASLGMPIDPKKFEADFGVYGASDGSTTYKNIVTEMQSLNGLNIYCYENIAKESTVAYRVESKKDTMCYRVGIAMDGETPVITITEDAATSKPIYGETSNYQLYMYIRYNADTSRIKECVLYRVPKDFDISGDDEYSDIFNLDSYRVIIE